eukprot:TRINITY_DN8179_c0_g1_i1.p1 TRINITY_DN8179_c0_g1~~TRINITY_DN8179_c0_g1_i1.p1  ORF type:complete len:391 (-),score=60.08 TRINITY_DN8179_c0_g1_i1:78-1250(-)
MKSTIAIFLLVSLLVPLVSSKIQCLDNNNNPVDWYWTYKMGRIVGAEGYNYLYTDSSNSGVWTQGNFKDSTNAVANTIRQLFPNGNYSKTQAAPVSDRAWIMYNDQTYDTLDELNKGECANHETDSSGVYYAHSKGDLCFDQSTGFWLIHSAPGFPLNHDLAPASWFYPSPQAYYGQSFFCISVSSTTADGIAGLMSYNYPHVYDTNLPSGWASTYPNTASLIANKYLSGHGQYSFSTLQGTSFIGFSKNSDTDSDLWEDYVAPGIKSGLIVEGWCGGTYGDFCEGSDCQGSPIVNASKPQTSQSTYAWDSINLKEISFGGNNWWYNRYDHAKWAMAYNPNSNPAPWVCPGDINRMTSQRKRGGGAACFQNSALWASLNQAVKPDTTCQM